MALVLVWIFMQLGGPGQPIREGSPAWSPDSTRIVFFREQSNHKADLFVVNADGSGEQQLTDTEDADEGGPAFSPDGRQLLYDSDLAGNFEIYVMDLDRRQSRRLTTHPGRDVAPTWSPDGSQIAFMSNRDNASGEFDLFAMNADGSNVERLTDGGTYWFPQYSPDGSALTFHLWRDVHVMDLATRTEQRLTTDPANGMYPTWSPDGQRLAFMSWRNGKTELFTMNRDGSDQQVLVSSPVGDTIDPRWSPDGTQIVYVQVPQARLGEAQDPNAERTLHILDMKTGQARRLSR